MDSSLTEQVLKEVVGSTIENNGLKVEKWLKGQPGSWGFLAGKALLTCRQRIGRRLTDIERRIVWHELWKSLSELRETLHTDD